MADWCGTGRASAILVVAVDPLTRGSASPGRDAGRSPGRGSIIESRTVARFTSCRFERLGYWSWMARKDRLYDRCRFVDFQASARSSLIAEMKGEATRALYVDCTVESTGAAAREQRKLNDLFPGAR